MSSYPSSSTVGTSETSQFPRSPIGGITERVVESEEIDQLGSPASFRNDW